MPAAAPRRRLRTAERAASPARAEAETSERFGEGIASARPVAIWLRVSDALRHRGLLWPDVLVGLLLALPAGAIAISRGFDGLYGQDPYAYFDYATVSLRQSILHLAPLEPFFWPPGYPLLVSLLSIAIGPTPLAGQLISLIMGASVPVLTALLVRELWPDDAALAVLAGVLVAVCGQLWQSSIVVMADTTGLALATFGAWSLVRYARNGRARWLLFASAAMAYA